MRYHSSLLRMPEMIQPTTVDSVALARRIRAHALRMTNAGGGSHIGAIFSCADILASRSEAFSRSTSF